MTTLHIDEADFLYGIWNGLTVGRLAFTQAMAEHSTDRSVTDAIELHFAAIEDVIEARTQGLRPHRD